uniref:Transmembrane protein 209 n=1 Tax=Parastrongyloides trichosuri TaxID=131310 RepID=A0A0N4ZXA6_PARTI
MIEWYYYGWITNDWLPRFILNWPKFLYYARGLICTVATSISITILVDLIVSYVIPSTSFYKTFRDFISVEKEINTSKENIHRMSHLVNLSTESIEGHTNYEDDHLYNIEMTPGFEKFSRNFEVKRKSSNSNINNTSQEYDPSELSGLNLSSIRNTSQSYVAPRHSLLTRPTESVYTLDQLEEFLNCSQKSNIQQIDFSDNFSEGYPSRNLGIQKDGLNGINNFAALTKNVAGASKILFQYQKERKENGYGSSHEDPTTSVLGKQAPRKKSPSSIRPSISSVKIPRNRGTRQNPNIYNLDETLKMYKLSFSDLCRCEGKLRIWIKQTILKPLLERIESANAQFLKDFPGHHLKIGDNSVETFQYLVSSKPEIFRNSDLGYVLPFLKVCQDQEYLIKRLNELATDYSLKNYLWKVIEKASTGDVIRLLTNNKSTACVDDTTSSTEKKFAPPKRASDTEILLHMFLTYLDHVLTSNPFAGYKTVDMPFSAIYFLKTPDEPSVVHRAYSSFYLHLDKLNPVHMRLVINGGEEIMDLGTDQNNFFRTIVIFIQHCYLYNNRMIDKIRLNDESLQWKRIIV